MWRGVGVALVTLFDGSGGLDAAGTAALAARLVDAGVRGVLVAGSTGEADTLTDDERVELIAAVAAACPGVPVLAGASGGWTGATARRVAAAVGAGADAVLVAPPRRPGDGAAARGAPVLAYHYPPVAGGAVPVDALPHLPVRALKDSSGDAERLAAELSTWDGDVYVGAATLCGYAGWLGAAGAILAVANAAPEDSVAAFGGDPEAQRRLFRVHLAAREAFPHGLKHLVARRYGTPTASRQG